MFKYFLNYCNDTTVHGFKYFGEKDRKRAEKCFWIGALLISSLACVYMFYELVEKIKNNPIVEYLAHEVTQISEIPFPAVSFCPEIRTIIDDFNYVEIIEKINNNEMTISELSDEKLNWIHAIGLLINDDFLLQFNLSLSTGKIMDSLHAVESEWRVKQKGSFIEKYSLEFAKVITPYGFCYTFNSLNSPDVFNLNEVADIFQFRRDFMLYEVNVERSIRPNMTLYPLNSPSFRMGLHLLLNKIAFGDPMLNHFGRIFEGHLVFIHKNEEFPMQTSKTFYSQLNETTIFLINPQNKVIDEDLYKLSIEERNCYLKNEKVLQFFKHYTKNNCENECLSTETLKACGCVQFFMIRNNSTTICGIYDKVCYDRIEYEVIGGLENICQCYSSCDTLNYDVDMKQLSFDGSTHPHKLVTESLPAEIFVIFKENEFFSLVRKKQFSNIDFLSYSGGILGLFAGISVLSIFELFYYFTIRVVGNKWKAWKSCKVIPIGNIQSRQGIIHNENKITTTLSENVLSYFKESSIHGCNYSVDTSRSLFERLFWIGSLSTSILICGVLITKLYHELQNHPIIITMDDKSYDIQNIPFPAITITTEYELEKTHRELWIRYLLKGERPDDPDEEDRINAEDGSLLEFASQVLVCKFYTMMRKHKHLDFEKIVPTIHNHAHKEWFKNQTAEWNTYYSPKFAEILTTRGYGYTFNILNAKDLLKVDVVSDDFIYDFNIGLKSLNNNLTKPSTTNLNYPLSAAARDNDGLTLTIKKNYIVNRPIICHDNGFLIHANDEIPLNIEITDLCEYEFGTTLDVIISPSVINTDEKLRSFSSERRNCYYDDERKLRFYKKYTKNNCEMECLSNHTFKSCGCVSFDVIRDKNTTVCGLNEVQCTIEALYDIKFDPTLEYIKKCHCLSKCNSIQYKVEYIQTKFNKNYGTSEDEFQIRFKFKDSEYIPLRRFQQFTALDFLASCGGLLGLFAGVSALSVVELFYFFSIRCFSNIINFFMAHKNNRIINVVE